MLFFFHGGEARFNVPFFFVMASDFVFKKAVKNNCLLLTLCFYFQKTAWMVTIVRSFLQYLFAPRRQRRSLFVFTNSFMRSGNLLILKK